VNKKLFLALMITSLPLLILISLGVGTLTTVNINTLFKVLLGLSLTKSEKAVITRRLVRTLAAMIVGFGLSYSGLSLQYILRNPLAEPYIIGLASGAALGVLTTYLIGLAHPLYVFISAIIGALAVFLIVLSLTTILGFNPPSIIIAGIAVTYSISSVNIFLIIKLLSKVKGAFYWLFGSVAYVLDYQLIYSSIPVIACCLWLLLRSRELTTLVLGDEVARALGVNVSRIRAEVIVCSAISTAAVVALAGPVGFIGLAAPWIARLTIGTDFRKLLPISVLTGSIMCIAADVIIRVSSPIMEVPLTAITSFMGAPILIYLLMKRLGWSGA